MADVEEKQEGTQGREQNDNPETRKNEQRGRTRTIRFVLLALLVVAAVVAIPVSAYYSARESTDDAQVDGDVIPVSARIAGTVVEVLVRDNQAVKAGQPLVRLDAADYQVSQAQAEAELASAMANTSETSVNVPLTNINTRTQITTSSSQTVESQAAVASAQQGVNAARAKLNSANSNLVGKQADQVKAAKDLARLKDLVDKDEISKQEYDAAVAAAQGSEADVESAKADAIAAQHLLDQAISDVAQARAKLNTAIAQQRQSEELRPRQQAVSEARHKQAQALVKQSEANLAQARLNVGYTLIRAPVDGVVSRKTVEPGTQVSPGQQMMALVPLDNVWVTANFKETQLRKMRVGQKVEFEVDTYGSGHKYRGYVESIAASSGAKFSLLPPENATGNYVKVVQRVPVKILLEPGENHDHLLLPGMSVAPTVLLNSGPNNPN
ncbi:MAG TPA: HlyD family secretion protein [Bryobacteraceae bacterium]|nr:HlyD family secretion protein [Bryobacteraceae bacterium]